MVKVMDTLPDAWALNRAVWRKNSAMGIAVAPSGMPIAWLSMGLLANVVRASNESSALWRLLSS